MRDSACAWLIVENAKIFWGYVKHFWILPREKNCRILNHVLDRGDQTKLVSASFSYFVELLNFISKGVIVSYSCYNLSAL